MAVPLRAVILFLALACSPALAQVQQIDASFQALLNALMQGTQVALLTPLPDGTLQVTSFTAPGQRSAAEAATLIEQARLNLANFGIQQPTGQQLATALAGGTLNVPTGSTSLVGVLPQTGTPPTLNTQVVTTAGLPQVIAPLSPGGVNAAAGGSVPSSARLTPAQQTQALQLAQGQLALLGITNPTPQQVAAMLNGGSITTPAGAQMTLPGLISAQPAQAPIVSSPAPIVSSPAPIVSPLPPSSTPVPSATPSPFLR